jgi:hypothetical protein
MSLKNIFLHLKISTPKIIKLSMELSKHFSFIFLFSTIFFYLKMIPLMLKFIDRQTNDY